jgi:protein-tyrosine phosphatase
VIDIHCHVLPGIDDGPRTLDESMELMRAAVAAGTSTIVATPHVSPQYPNDSGTIARLAQEVNLRAREDGIGLRVLTGAEIAMTRAADLAPEELNAMALAGAGWLLIECPFSPVATGLQALVGTLQDQGYRIVLAHPERCPAFHRDPDILRSLSRSGALSSITAGSLVGRFGSTVHRFRRPRLRPEASWRPGRARAVGPRSARGLAHPRRPCGDPYRPTDPSTAGRDPRACFLEAAKAVAVSALKGGESDAEQANETLMISSRLPG